MDNLILRPKSKEIEQFSQQLGFQRTLFLNDDFVLITAKNHQEILAQAQRARQQQKLSLFRPPSEELLRFALEKTAVDLVFGVEQFHAQDSFHFVRGGLDQVLGKIAAQKSKIIAFSLADILSSSQRPRLLARMMFNIQICQKYKVRMFFSTFASGKMELRAAHDLLALWRVLGGKGKEELAL